MDAELALAQRVAGRLGRIEGVIAVVLGGSRARDEAHADSDIDLGIYYRPDAPPDVEALRALARELDDRDKPDAVTSYGEWGPWINGGAWLQIEGERVDWLYRDLDRVRTVIDDCRAGVVTCDYQVGHPHGFHNHMYMAEVHICVQLFDPGDALAPLKALTTPYPAELRRAIVHKYGWEAGFALTTTAKAAARGDVHHVAGSLFRCAACLVQVLFALNERYFTNEKGSLRVAESFATQPGGFSETVAGILAQPGSTPEELQEAVGQMNELRKAVVALANDAGLDAG